MKGKISRSGFRSNSPDKNNDFNIIPSSNISMQGVNHPVFGIDELGNMKFMLPGEEHQFAGKKVLEIPMKNGGEAGYPFFLNLGGIPGMQYAQDGAEVYTPDKIKVIKKAADINKAEQKIAAQYNLEGLPSITERNTWNNYLDWVETQGYKPGSDSFLSLNKGTNRFTELSSTYNTQMTDKLKADYAKVKVRPGFDKTITEDQYVQSRQVNPQMMINAQKVYGQQTSKDQWFGSETARTFYPKIQGLGVAYENPGDPNAQAKMASAAGKLAPVQVYDYKTGKAVPYKGVVPISGYDPKGSPQYNWENVQPFQPSMASKVYYDPAGLTPTAKTLYQPYLPSRQQGGDVDKNFFNTFLSTHFDGKNDSEAPQGHDTESYIEAKRKYFLHCLRENAAKHLMKGEMNNLSDVLNKAQDGMQVNLYDPNDPTKKPPVNNMNDFYAGPFGNNNVQTPSYVTDIANSQPVFYTDPAQAGTPSNLSLNARGDIDEIAYEKYMQDNIQKGKNARTASNVATGVVAGMNMFSSFSEYMNNKKYQDRLKAQMSGDNVFGTIKPSRGDYEMNSGAFRPNQMTPPVYKKGGQYKLDDSEIQNLRNLGYEIEIVE